MQLIYRGELINSPNQPIASYRKPHALNWRYQPAGEAYETTPMPAYEYKAPRAINWRWQMSLAIQ